MSEEADNGVGLMVMDDEQRRDEGGVLGPNQLVKLGKMKQYLWKILLVLHWEVSSHCIVARAVKGKKYTLCSSFKRT